jgi:hypothetical protein
VLVSKQADNKQLLAKYGKRARRSVDLDATAEGKGRAGGRVDKDYRLRVLKQKENKVLVRDLFGREGWVDKDDLY